MTKPTTTYMICTTARSGSNLLCDYLSNAGLFGSPWEFFNPNTIRHGHLGKKFLYNETLSVSAYIDWLMESYTSPNGVFGVKVLYNDFEAFRGFPAFKELFQRCKKIHLSRKSKTRQAVSYHFASHTGQWVATDVPRLNIIDVPFEFEVILGHRENLIRQDLEWQSVIDAADKDYLEITHEAFTKNVRTSIESIALFLGIPGHFSTETRLEQQSNRMTAEFIRQFDAAYLDRLFTPSGSMELARIPLSA